MLRLTIPALVSEQFNEETNEFLYTTISKEQILQLEHSLVSLTKWESKWNKAFLSKTEKTDEEILDYVRCMTLTQNVPPDVYNRLTAQNYADINAYIEAPMTATRFSEDGLHKKSQDVITAEVIDYWMITYNIPVEFRKWHLNKLLTLIRVCEVKNSPPKKRSKRELMRRNAALNAARRNRLNSTG